MIDHLLSPAHTCLSLRLMCCHFSNVFCVFYRSASDPAPVILTSAVSVHLSFVFCLSLS